jgi:hypothetical protein
MHNSHSCEAGSPPEAKYLGMGPGLKFELYRARHFECVEAAGRLMPKRGVSSCKQIN